MIAVTLRLQLGGDPLAGVDAHAAGVGVGVGVGVVGHVNDLIGQGVSLVVPRYGVKARELLVRVQPGHYRRESRHVGAEDGSVLVRALDQGGQGFARDKALEDHLLGLGALLGGP